MDLSNLSSDLPAAPSVQQQAAERLSRELALEFKTAANAVAALYNSHEPEEAKSEFSNAAKAVTRLYRLANKKSVSAADQGYTDCLDDLLLAIANGDDIEDWALTRRAEIRKQDQEDLEERDKNSEVASSPVTECIPELVAPPLENSRLPNHVFSAPAQLAAPQHFYPGIPPPSVAHSVKQRASIRRKPRKEGKKEEWKDGSDSDSDSGRKRRKKKEE
ncbi:hypothetical protein JA9_002788 [Meyerozyma sp. JA9]|nr:hypothetical protein JA9_002788 [Meyerozyma sp. JA9]